MADSYPQKLNMSGTHLGNLPSQQPPSYDMQFPSAAPIPIPPVTVIQTQQVGPHPQRIQCPSCNATIVTRIEHVNTSKTHLFALSLCLVGCWLCCCIPYCMDTCRNTTHYCSNCNAYIGAYGS